MCKRNEARFWQWHCYSYRRAKKKEKEKKAAKELEELAITDPQAVVEKMEAADRKRIEVGGSFWFLLACPDSHFEICTQRQMVKGSSLVTD